LVGHRAGDVIAGFAVVPERIVELGKTGDAIAGFMARCARYR
jgi:hypothetical protein